MTGVMTPRCKRCRDGLVVLHTSEGRRTVTCACERGQARDQSGDMAERGQVSAPPAPPPAPYDDLKARLLAAFWEVVNEPPSSPEGE